MTQDDKPIRGDVRRAGLRRVSHGLAVPLVDGLDDHAEFIRDLDALVLVLPDDAVFTHVTAARVLGWRLPALPEQVPYFAATRCHRRPRRPGLICSRLTHDAARAEIRGVPVDSPEEILLRCARDLGVIDLVIMIDSALRLRHLTSERMREILLSKRPGVARLRQAWRLVNPRAESAGETLLRLFHEAMDVPTRSQVDLHSADGQFLGRADLLVEGTRLVHEYDGAGHRTRQQHKADLRRERGLASTSYRRCGFTLDDLLNHPGVVMHQLDQLLSRPHRARRIERWRTLVAESLYSSVGRTRVMNRWKRQMGVVEWS